MPERGTFVILPNERTARLLTSQEEKFWQGQWKRRLGGVKAAENVAKYGLVHYESPEVPYTGLYLLGFLREAGWEYGVVDLWDTAVPQLSQEKVELRLAEVPSNLFLFSPFTTNYPLAVQCAEVVKRLYPNALCIAGGHHVSARPEEALGDGFDYVVVGHGEQAMKHIAGSGCRNLGDIPGAVFLDGGRLRRVPRNPTQTNVNEMPLPAFEVLPPRYRRNYYTRLFTAHGCPYRCVFCSSQMWAGIRPWYKSLDRIKKELECVRRTIEFEEIYVGDETFTADSVHARQVGAFLRESGVTWGAETRLNLADDATMRALADLGCREMGFGLESLDPEILKLAEKRIDPASAGRIFRDTHELGIRTHVNLMIGLPGETRETALSTVDTVCEWIAKSWISTVDYFVTVPYPGTQLFEQPEKYGITLRTRDWRLYREDNMPVYDLSTLRAEEIYELWLEGMERICAAYGSTAVEGG